MYCKKYRITSVKQYKLTQYQVHDWLVWSTLMFQYKMKNTDVPIGQTILNYKYEYQIQIIYEYEKYVPMPSG
jgi:hypothetical protein